MDRVALVMQDVARGSVMPRCDSSHCLVCHAGSQACPVHGPACGSNHFQLFPPGYSPRSLSHDDTTASWQQREDTTAEQETWQHDAKPRPWRFDAVIDGQREDPAPAQLVQAAELVLGPAQFVSALEFSQDGRLLATGSCMRKEVRLYNLQGLLTGLHASSHTPTSWLTASAPEAGSLQIQAEEDSFSADSSEESLQPQLTPGACSTAAGGTTSWVPAGSSTGSQWWAVHTQPLQGGGSTGIGACGSSIRASSHAQARRAAAGTCNPVAIHRLPGKVSCMSWSPSHTGVVCVGDYDGVITQLHMLTGHQLRDVDGHGGKRIWGLAHSHPSHQPLLCASASDDGTARLWAGPYLDTCTAVIRPPEKLRRAGSGSSQCSRGGSSSVCGVDFSPSPLHPHLLALACADHSAYVYDIRSTQAPLYSLHHHTRPVSYAKFFRAGQLVTASTDGSLALWDLGSVAGATSPGPGERQATDSSNPASAMGQVQQPTTALLTTTGSGVDASDSTMEDATALLSTDDSFSTTSWPAQPPSLSKAHRMGSASSLWQVLPPQAQHTQHAAPAAATAEGAVSEVKPYRVWQGHKNERNFVGLAVRPEDGLVACGSETSCVYTYHTAWSAPLASSNLQPLAATGSKLGAVATWQPTVVHHGAQPHQRLSVDANTARWQQSQAGVAATHTTHTVHATQSHMQSHMQSLHNHSGASVASHKRSSTGSSCSQPFVSAVAWQSAAAAAAAGLPPLLAAGTSAGTVRLMILERPS